MLNSATPLILTGLAVMLAFKANVLNIGSEGQFITGAIGGFTVGYYGATHFPNLPALPMLSVLLLAGFVSGAIPALIAGLMQQYRHVPVVLSTILMNFACAILLKALLQGPLHQQQEGLASEALPEIALLPHITIHGTATFLHYGFFIAIALAMLLFLIFKFTVFGFKLRITGENPTAAKFAGIRVSSVMLICLCLSGGVAGMAGAIQISGNSSYQLLPSTASLGLGFAGIAVALLGRLSPIAIIPAAIFFGWLNVAFAALQTKLEVPSLALQAVQGSIMIMLLIVGRLQKRTA